MVAHRPFPYHFAPLIFAPQVFALLALSLGAQQPSAETAAAPSQQPLPHHRLIEARVNTHTGNRQQDATLAVAGDGRVLVAWSSRRQEFGTEGVFAQLLDPLGRPLGTEMHVNEYCRGQQAQPAAAFAPDGSALVAWSSVGQEGPGVGVYLRRLGATEHGFAPLGPEIRVAETTAGDQFDPVLALDASGRALVCWVTGRGGPTVVHGRYFDLEGRALGGEFRVGEVSTLYERLPTVCGLGGGRFVVAWARAEADGRPAGLYARLLGEAEGAPELRLDEVDLVAVEPSVDADGAGNFVAAWMAAPAAGEWYPMARRFDRSGKPLGASFSLPISGDGACNGVTVAMAPDGRFAVAWNEEGEKRFTDTAERPEKDVRILAQLFDAAGAPMGEPLRVHAAEDGLHTLQPAHNARHAAWSALDQLAFAWHGAAGDDEKGVGLSLFAPLGLDVPAPPAVEPVEALPSREAFDQAPPEWDPNWVDDSYLPTPPPAGPDFGFTAFNSTGWYPPDPDLAVGPDHIVVVVNVAMQIYTKGGQSQYYTNLEPFFNTTGFVFDPTALYDPHSGRYIIAACEHAPNGDDHLDVAVSDDSDPNGTWHKYRFDFASFCDFIDFDNLGVGKDAIFMAADCFAGGGNNLYVFDKTPMLSGQPVTPVHITTAGYPISTGTTKVYDTNTSTGYFLSTFYVGSPVITLFAITDPIANPQLRTFNLTVGAYTFPPDAQQQGTSALADTIDWRIKNGVVRNGRLYCCHNIGGSDFAAKARWYEIDLRGWPDSGQTPIVLQLGNADPGFNIDTWHADINVDTGGNVVLAYSRSSPSELISVERAAHLVADAPGTLRPGVTLQTSTQPDFSGRWGDYSGVEEDPAEPGSFWSHNEYTLSSWRTWCARFTAEARLRLTQSVLFRGLNAVFTVDNAISGEIVWFLYSTTGQGAGACPPQLGGSLCLDILDPVTISGSVPAATGIATLIVQVPPNAPLGVQVWSQAVARRGPGGADSVKSNVTVETVQ
ncbi:MAG: hypothetical protein EYC70_15395 [Planctomycetota bacterium]|nr:MAG: hypothetical protein EYC70_15395 [Planctomycetota bacterium]